jgi:hypothetical protein
MVLWTYIGHKALKGRLLFFKNWKGLISNYFYFYFGVFFGNTAIDPTLHPQIKLNGRGLVGFLHAHK